MYLAKGLDLLEAVALAGTEGAGLVCLSAEDDEHPMSDTRQSIVSHSFMTLIIRENVILNFMHRRSAWLILLAAISLTADSGAGIRWTTPANWKAQEQRAMRLANYTVPPASGDQENGKCGVYYFGQGQGGSVQANMDRWIGQFQQADGKPSKDAAKVGNRNIHGLKVTTVDVSGSYTGMGGPRAPQGPPKSGYRLLGAIVEGSQGSVLFKLSGPAKTVVQNQSAFEKMLASISSE
jgi:hypothetical protein